MTLREQGIYSLPNGSELVVNRKHERGPVLYQLRSWNRFETSEFEINEAGRLLTQGRLTAWDITNLKDTGRSAFDVSPHQQNH